MTLFPLLFLLGQKKGETSFFRSDDDLFFFFLLINNGRHIILLLAKKRRLLFFFFPPFFLWREESSTRFAPPREKGSFFPPTSRQGTVFGLPGLPSRSFFPRAHREELAFPFFFFLLSALKVMIVRRPGSFSPFPPSCAKFDGPLPFFLSLYSREGSRRPPAFPFPPPSLPLLRQEDLFPDEADFLLRLSLLPLGKTSFSLSPLRRTEENVAFFPVEGASFFSPLPGQAKAERLSHSPPFLSREK